ncbi:MAG: helix-turn-helix transcriptional regulator [Pseudonocardiales bacterium]
MTDEVIMSPVHPGEVLQQEYLDPLGLTQHRVAAPTPTPTTENAAQPRTATCRAS